MDDRIIGFQVGKDLRGNRAAPVLQTTKKLKPREVISEAEKHLKTPRGWEEAFTEQFSGSE